MTKQCDHCGTSLPDVSTRFCPACGKLVASSRPLKKISSDHPPAWMKQLETSLTVNRPQSPRRELNVKVWNEETTTIGTSSKSEAHLLKDNEDVSDSLPTSPLTAAHASQTTTPASLSGIDTGHQDAAEELPTNPHMNGISQHTPVNQPSSMPGISSQNGLQSRDQIDEMATRPYVAQPRSISPEMEMPLSYQQGPVLNSPSAYKTASATQKPVTPLPLTFPQYPATQSSMQTPPASIPVPTLTSRKERGRKGLLIVVGLLAVALLASFITWVVLAQPFSVPEITATTQHFTNAALGISLQYPRDWSTDVHVQSGTVRLFDDNHTDQVNITVAAVDNQGLSRYSAKFASALGMTGQKTLAQLEFAGTTWQQIQGNVQQSGASYTVTLLVTQHGGRYYAFMQLAPSSTYLLEEQLVFSKMRSSLQFS